MISMTFMFLFYNPNQDQSKVQGRFKDLIYICQNKPDDNHNPRKQAIPEVGAKFTQRSTWAFHVPENTTTP